MAAKKTAKKSTDPDVQAPAKLAKPAAPAAKKAATKTAAKKAAPAPKATKTAAKKAAPKAPKAAEKKPSLDEIARGAYLNYRSRVENGLPGDSHNDWLEAERQLGVIH